MRRTTLSALMTVAAVAALSPVVTAAPASADTNAATLYSTCEGTRIAHSNIAAPGGDVLSTVEVYASGTGRLGKLCARNVHRGSHYGTSMPTSVRIDGTYDSGSYAYFAGAIRIDWYDAADASVVYGGSNPEVAGRTVCIRSAGTTAGLTKVIWLCYPAGVSR